MSRPYTADDFSKQITEDRNWRIKEISYLESAIKKGDKKLQTVLLRALVAICYAHWEGYVRFSAKKYLEYVALRKLKYDALDRQFYRNSFLPRLAALSTSKSSIKERCALIDEILNSSDQIFSRADKDLINTKSNMNSAVFSDICLVCGIPTDRFSDNFIFIDIFLLKRRNSIAHGENTFIELDDLDTLSKNTITLMQDFGNELENRIVLRTFEVG